MSSGQPFRVVITGGGVAALEAALALRDLAGERVALTLVAPDGDFVYRPLSVREPFAYAPARRYPLGDIAAELGAELVAEKFEWVDAEARVAHAGAGTELPYDALILALGARPHTAFAHATTIDDRHMDELLHGVVQDVEAGYVRTIAFVTPARMPWPLPLYELALMTAYRAYDMNATVKLTLVTAERAPLALFGEAVSREAGEMFATAGIEVIASTELTVPDARHVVVGTPPERSLEVDRVIALPELFGPAVRGLPAGEHGFIPVDRHGQVRGTVGVFAAGDATDGSIKYGGVAAAQADAVARSVAALAGVTVADDPVEPVIRGVLLTGGKPRYLTARLTSNGELADAQLSSDPGEGLPTKITARYLTPFLQHRDAS